MVICDQYNCEYHQPEKDSRGRCTAATIVLAEAPGGFWLSCRMKTNGKQWRPADTFFEDVKVLDEILEETNREKSGSEK